MKTMYTGRSSLWIGIPLATLALIANLLICGFLQVRPAFAANPITVNVGKQTQGSNFEPGISDIDNSLVSGNPQNNSQAINGAKALIHNGVPYVNEFLMGWGSDDPWPDPSQNEPTNWGSLDQKMQLAVNAGATPVLSLGMAPWWMMGMQKQDGTTQQLTQNDDFSNLTYQSRVLDNMMSAWLHLVQRAAERYMAPPYNVRYFQIWNELKGYYDFKTNNWDYDDSPGNPNQPTANHGYTYMYNQVYQTLMQVAQEKGIDPSTVKVGGPYAVMTTYSSSSATNLPTTYAQPYGVYDKHEMDAVQYWLQHKDGAGFITIDGANSNNDKDIVDPYTSSDKFADIVHWIRGLDNTQYPGAATLPIWLAEWYALPSSANASAAQANSVQADAIIKFLNAGGSVALLWGGASQGNDALGETNTSWGLWTQTNDASGGKSLPWYDSYKAFRDDFGAGTPIYQTTTSSDAIDALVSAKGIMLVNKTDQPQTVSIKSKNVKLTLSAYDVAVIDTRPHQAPQLRGQSNVPLASNSLPLAVLIPIIVVVLLVIAALVFVVMRARRRRVHLSSGQGTQPLDELTRTRQ
jgi:hypothetical protein